MEKLSTEHLYECMQETMEPTQKRLMSIYPIIRRTNKALCEYLEKSTVGTLFALPWFLTWFGHSLNSYRSVVRLYDYFLASEPLLPLYVTAAIVLYRENDIFKEDCDIASLHCLLSQLPEDLPFEYLLTYADTLYKKFPPKLIEDDVEKMIIKEKQQRALEDERLRKLQLARRMKANPNKPFNKTFLNSFIPFAIMSRRSMIVTTAFSIFVGICAYFYRAYAFNGAVRERRTIYWFRGFIDLYQKQF